MTCLWWLLEPEELAPCALRWYDFLFAVDEPDPDAAVMP